MPKKESANKPSSEVETKSVPVVEDKPKESTTNPLEIKNDKLRSALVYLRDNVVHGSEKHTEYINSVLK